MKGEIRILVLLNKGISENPEHGAGLAPWAMTCFCAASYLTMSGGSPVEMFHNNAAKGALGGFAIKHQ